MKNKFILAACAGLGIALPFMFANSDAHAFTISDTGEYTLAMNIKASDYDADIDGSYSKLLKFDFDDDDAKNTDGYPTVKLYDLTKGIVPFNGKNEFSGWALSSDSTKAAAADTTLCSNDFNYKGSCEGVSYDKGKSVYALFSDKLLKNTDKYYLTLDAYGGKMPGKKEVLRLIINKDEFTKEIDLKQYTPERENCKFCGWGIDGKIVDSIDESYFSENSVVKVTALYKSTLPFYGVDDEGRLNNPNLKESDRPNSYTLVLDANGGTIDGVSSKEYDYLGGGNSGTEMYVFHYIPEREGYKFIGWNSQSNGSGKICNSVYWNDWLVDSTSEYVRKVLTNDEKRYKNLFLYATWEKTSEDEDQSKEIFTREESELKGSLKTDWEIDENYMLDIKKTEIPEGLENNDIKLVLDINVLNSDFEIVEMNGMKMKIKIELPEELKGYNHYEVVYINQRTNKIKETLPATIENGCLVFETTHLSLYGIVAKNIEENDPNGEDKSSEEIDNKDKNENNENMDLDKNDEVDSNNDLDTDEENFMNFITGDATTSMIVLFSVISLGVAAFPILNKKK